MRSRSIGFTLVELLVVIAIIGILVGLLLPAVQAAREAARRMQCSNNIKQLVLSIHNYADTFKTFPIGAQYSPGHHHTWIVGILPYIEQQNLSNQIPYGIFTAAEVPAGQVSIPPIICPSDPGANNGRLTPGGNVARSGWWWNQSLGASDYRACIGGNWGWAPYAFPGMGRNSGPMADLEWGDGAFPRNKYYNRAIPMTTKFGDISDGTSNTLAIGETLVQWADDVCWVDDNGTIGTTAIPLNLYKTQTSRSPFAGDWRRSYGFASQHTGGGQFGRCDGSVHFISDSINGVVYRAVASISGGEVVTLDE